MSSALTSHCKKPVNQWATSQRIIKQRNLCWCLRYEADLQTLSVWLQQSFNICSGGLILAHFYMGQVDLVDGLECLFLSCKFRILVDGGPISRL